MSKNDLSFQLAQKTAETGHGVVPTQHFWECLKELLLIFYFSLRVIARCFSVNT